jgi:hypothetical protein
MPINGYHPSSQTVFYLRQSALTPPYFTTNGHVFSSPAPALRAASAEPSAVRPDGLGDVRDVVSEATVIRPATPVDGERPAARGWQDKAVLTDGPPASSQPGPDTIVARSSVVDNGSVRSQNDSVAKERLVKGAVWMRPGVKEAIEGLADQTGLSFSATAAKGLEIYARAKIQDQQEELFEPRMRLMMRREIRASDNRHIYFEMRNAIASEQTRILTTDLYKRQLVKEEVPLKEINAKLDNAYNMARTNVLRKAKTPQLKSLLVQWWRLTEDWASDRQDQAENRGEGTAGEEEQGRPSLNA